MIVVNSDKLVLTGKKWSQKKYFSVSRYVGSLKEKLAKDMKKEDIIKKAVQGMLPKNKHRDKNLKRLKIFKGPDHIYKDKPVEVYEFGSKAKS